MHFTILKKKIMCMFYDFFLKTKTIQHNKLFG